MYTADVAVIGGGIVGLSIAAEAAARGLRPIVMDKTAPGAGATRVAAGMLDLVAERDAHPELLVLGRKGCELYPAFLEQLQRVSGIDCDYETKDTYLVATHRDDLAHFESLLDLQGRRGISAQWVAADELRALEPRLSPRTLGGYRARGEAQVNPRKLAAALAQMIRLLGGKILHPITLESVEHSHCIHRLRLSSAIVEAPILVVAAGANSADILPELPALPLRPVKGQILRLVGPALISAIIRSPKVYLLQRSDGELIVGATSEEMGFDLSVTAEAVWHLLDEARRVLPSVMDCKISDIMAGHRPALRDHLPAIGSFGPAGVYVATGHYRHGVKLAPITAKLLVEQIISGHAPDALAPFDPNRFFCPQDRHRQGLQS